MLERWEAALIISSMKEIIECKRISRRSNVLLHGLSGIVEWRFYVYEEFIFEIQSKMQNICLILELIIHTKIDSGKKCEHINYKLNYLYINHSAQSRILKSPMYHSIRNSITSFYLNRWIVNRELRKLYKYTNILPNTMNLVYLFRFNLIENKRNVWFVLLAPSTVFIPLLSIIISIAYAWIEEN